MKTLLIACIALALPLFLIAQDDWCTCMETESRYEAVTSYVSSQSQSSLLLLTSSVSTPVFEDNSRSNYSEARELPQPASPPAPDVDEAPEVEEVPAAVRAARSARKDAIKKRKKIFKKRLKKRKRFRKYKGKCPTS